MIIGDKMKAKEKEKKRKKIHLKITLKGIISFLTFIISLLYVVIFYNYYFVKNDVYATEVSSNVEITKISKAKQVDIEEIISENVKQGQREEYSVQEATLEYMTKYRDNANLAKGTIQVIQEGREGKQEITTKKIYQNEELVSEEQIACKITKASMDKIVEVGTANYTNNYTVKVGDTIYATSDRLAVMYEPNEKSQKVATLSQQKELKVLEIQGDWYKIVTSGVVGYVKAESTKYVDNTPKQEDKPSVTVAKSKGELTSGLGFDMALNKPSGLTLEQFKSILTDSKDTNKIFENNAKYFYYIEQQYNINGVFVAAIGIHESAWGTSQIARDKNNLFGYGAYDSNPYNGAYSFSDYSESIDLIARVLVKYYLNAKGTSIFGGEQAVGTYYNGPTLSGVNTRYATDKNWANGVYSHMKYLYNKL